MKKMNLKKLKQLEEQYKDSTVTLHALNEMVQLVLNFNAGRSTEVDNSALTLAITTLTELKVLESSKIVEPLNS